MATPHQTPQTQTPAAAYRLWHIWVIFCGGLLLTGLLSALLANEQEKTRARIFSAMSSEVVARLQQQLRNYEHGLRGLRGVIVATGGIDTLDKKTFLEYIRSRDPKKEFAGIRGFGFINRIPVNEESNFLEKMKQQDNGVDFKIKYFQPHNEERWVIQEIEPAEDNKGARGLDMASEQRRKNAVIQASQQGKTTITAPLRLVQASGDTNNGFLIFTPIYPHNKIPDTIEERYKQVTGLTYLPLVINEAMQSFFWDAEKIRIDLSDTEYADGEFKNFYSSEAKIEKNALISNTEIEIFGRYWKISLSSTPKFEESLPYNPWQQIIFIGLIISSFLSWAAWLNYRKKLHAEQVNKKLEHEVAERTHDLSNALHEIKVKSEQYRALFEQNPLGVIVLDANTGKIEHANLKTYKIITGSVQTEQESNKNFVEKLCNQWLFHFLEEKINQSNRAPLYQEEFIQRLDNTPIWVRLTITPIRVSTNTEEYQGYWMILIEDITSQYHQSRQLEETSERLRLATETAQIGIWFWRFEQNVFIWDQRTYEIFGVTNYLPGSALPYTEGVERVHPDDQLTVHERLQESRHNTLEWQVNFRCKWPDNSVRYIESRAVIWRDNGKVIGMLGIHRDVTERQNQEIALISAREAAEAANIAKSQFLANMSHEVRTPMNAILGMLTILVEDADLTSTQHNYIKKARESASALLRILNDILDFSRLESGTIDLESEQLSIDEVVSRTCDLFSASAGEKGLDLLIKTTPEINNIFIGDSLRLGQILNNLVGNAIKFTSKGSILVQVSSEGKIDAQGRELIRFEIKDTGIGLTKSQSARLFKPFSQADNSTTRRYGGSGLGLSICRQLVQLMDGEIHVDSELDVGSNFWFTIPLLQHKKNTSSSITLSKEHILLVEKAGDSRRTLQSYMQAWQLNVELAETPEEAYKIILESKLKGNEFTLLIIDWKSSSQDGLWLLNRLHHEAKNNHIKKLPSVFMTVAHEHAALVRLAAQGPILPDVILNKPVTASRLHDVIANVQKRGFVKDNDTDLILKDIPYSDRTQKISGARLLLVEDNSTNQEVATIMLKRMGMVVDIANHGGEALQRLAESNYDLVLMDLHMPVMNGVEATRIIRAGKWGNSLPIIAMTAAVFSADREEVLNAGMNDFVSKPIDPQQLASVLLRWLPARSTSQLTIDYTPNSFTIKTASTEKKASNLLSSLKYIEVNETLRRLDNDKELLSRLLQRFDKEFKEWPLHAKDAYKKQSIEKLFHLAHTLKGTSANVGAIHINTQAAALERYLLPLKSVVSINKKEWQEINILLDSTCQNLEKTLREIESNLSERRSKSTPSNFGTLN